jgi:hypothetical protein
LFSEQNLRRTGIIAVCGLVLSGLILAPACLRVVARIGRVARTQPDGHADAARNCSGSTGIDSDAFADSANTETATDRIAPTLGEPPPPPR